MLPNYTVIPLTVRGFYLFICLFLFFGGGYCVVLRWFRSRACYRCWWCLVFGALADKYFCFTDSWRKIVFEQLSLMIACDKNITGQTVLPYIYFLNCLMAFSSASWNLKTFQQNAFVYFGLFCERGYMYEYIMTEKWMYAFYLCACEEGKWRWRHWDKESIFRTSCFNVEPHQNSPVTKSKLIKVKV